MFDLELFAQYLANGLVVGSTYVLVAVGLTLIFGILGVVNFAHGEFYMLGAYAGIFLVSGLGLGVLPAILGVLAICALMGILAEIILHKSLRGRDPTNSMISSFGLAVVLQNAALIAFGPQPQILRTNLSAVPVEIGPIFLPLQRLLIPIVMVVLIVALQLALRYTWAGRSLRAMAQHPTAARLCGVRVERVAVMTFMIGTALAGVGGMLMSAVYLVYPVIGGMIVLKAFTVVILGGMGNIGGAAIAGLLLGVSESLTSAYISNGARDAVGFIMVVAALLFRPQGLFGRSVDRS